MAGAGVVLPESSERVTEQTLPRPRDVAGEAVAEALASILFGSAVEITYTSAGQRPPESQREGVSATATAPGPDGWDAHLSVTLGARVARLVDSGEGESLSELLRVLPGAALRVAEHFRPGGGEPRALSPAGRRALRDSLAAEILAEYAASRLSTELAPMLIPETIEYLIELSGSRVEAHELTHGVVISDVLGHPPRLQLAYPDGMRPVKRAPLLFDGQRSVLVVDPQGRARTELQRHRFDRLAASRGSHEGGTGWLESGSLVADATRALHGVGFFVRADRSIWTFVDGQPLLVRRGEHWTAFPVELTASIRNMIGEGRGADLVARAAFMISAQPHGAILAIVEAPDAIDGVVADKDRYDLRASIDAASIRPETWLHHLIDASELDEQTLARLAILDGATVIDRDGALLAYGAIVETAASEHEGARTAAARALSKTAAVVLKVSVDGDITIFRAGRAVTTLLGHPTTAVQPD